LAAAIALRLTVRSDWFLKRAEEEFERGLDRKVSFSSLSPSLLYGVGVRIRDFTLFEKDGRTPCLRADGILIRVRIIPLLWKSLNLSSLSITRPRLALVRDKDGKWNVEGLFRKEKPAAVHGRAGRVATGKKKGRGQFSISRLRVSNGSINISDAAWDRQAVLEDVDLKATDIAQGTLPYLKGKALIKDAPLDDLARAIKETEEMNVRGGSLSGPVSISGWLGERLKFQAKLSVEGVRLSYGKRYEAPERGLAMNVDIRGEGSYLEKAWDIGRIDAELFDGRLKANGSLLSLGREPKAQLKITGRDLLWNEIGTLRIPDLSLDGSSTFSATIKGGKEDLSVNLDVDLGKSGLSYGAAIKKRAGSKMELKIPLRREGANVQWKEAALLLEGLQLASDGSFQTAGVRTLKARLKADDADLKGLNGVLVRKIITGGNGDMDMSFERSLDQPLSSAKVSGSARVAGGELKFSGLGKPVTCDAVCAASDGNVRLGLNTVRIGSSYGEGFLSFDLEKWPAFDCEFNFPVVDSSDFVAASPAQKEALRLPGISFVSAAEAAPIEPQAAQFALPPLLMELEGKGRISCGELRLGKLRARDGRGEIILSKGVLSLDGFSLPLYGGESKWKLTAAMSGPEPRYALEGMATRVELSPLLSDLYGYSDALSGWLSLECLASGAGRGWSAIRDTVRAKGRFSIHEGRLCKVGLLKEIAPLFTLLGREAKCKEFLSLGALFERAPAETRFSRCEGDFGFEGRRWATGNMLLEVARKPAPLRLKLKGQMGLGGALDLRGRVSFPRDSDYYRQLEPYFPDDGGWITVPFPIPIGGTLDRPRVNVDAARKGILSCAAEIGAARLRKEIEKKIDRALEPKPDKKGEKPPASDGGREMLKGVSKELLKQMMKQ
jgi:uncharacterized protein involved in outer membrane biogenesis